MLGSPQQSKLGLLDYKDSRSMSQLLIKVSINGKLIIIKKVTRYN